MAYLSNVTINDTGMNSSNSQWLHQLWKNSVVAGGPRVFIPGVDLANIIPWMENPGTLPPPTTLASVTSVNNIESNLNQPPTRRPRPTRRPNTRRPSLPTAHPVTARATTPRPITFDQYGLSTFEYKKGLVNNPNLKNRYVRRNNPCPFDIRSTLVPRIVAFLHWAELSSCLHLECQSKNKTFITALII